jgi:outer membrane biosynthesis protein TonB
MSESARLPAPGPAPSGTWDYQPLEVASGALAAIIVLFGTYLAFELTKMTFAKAPEADIGAERAVRVIPMLDLDAPLLKLGGKKPKLPDAWVKKTPQKLEEKKAFVSTKAEKTEDAIPPEEVKIADAGTKPPDPDAEVVKEQETPIEEQADAGEQAFAQEGHAAGDEKGTETDPLKARAIDQYRARVASFFSSRFRVSGSGLPEEQLTSIRVGATVTLAGTTVTGFSLSPSGNPAFDSAAQAALQSTVGSSIPPPPENYPDLGVGSSFSVTFYCGKGRCD